MLADQFFDQSLGVRTGRIHVLEGGSASGGGADIRLLARIELGVDPETVLEVVDAEVRGFGIGDRTKVPGDLQSTAVGLLDGGPQLIAGDVHVGLERSRALVGPEGHGFTRVFRVLELDAFA